MTDQNISKTIIYHNDLAEAGNNDHIPEQFGTSG
jgi:hypothetical protein